MKTVRIPVSWLTVLLSLLISLSLFAQDKKNPEGGVPVEYTSLFSDDFERTSFGTNYDSYLRNMGTPVSFIQPQIVNFMGSRRAEITAKDSQEAYLYINESVGGTWSSYNLEFDVDFTRIYKRENATFEVGFNVSNIIKGAQEFQFSGYKIVYRPYTGVIELIKRTSTAGNYQVLSTLNGFSLSPDSSFHFRIEVTNRNIKAYYNFPGAASVLLFDYTDNTVNPYLLGTAFWGTKSAVVKVDNVSIFTSPAYYVTVISPNGGEGWPVLSNQTIRWVSNSTSTLKIVVADGNSLDEVYTIASGVPAAQGSYSFMTIPDLPVLKGYNHRIKILGSQENQTFYDISDRPFTIGKAKLYYPTGGQVFISGTANQIHVAAEGLSSPVVEYKLEGQSNWNYIAGFSNTAFQIINWDAAQIQGRLKLRVRDGATGESIVDEGNFITVTSLNLTKPSGGEAFPVGSTAEIKWDPNSVIGNINILFSKDDFNTSVQIASNINASTGTYNWVVPNNITTNGRIRLVSAAFPALTSTSQKFRIAKLTLLTPNGGEKLQAGSTYRIYWDGEEGTDNLDIQFSTNNGTSWEHSVEFNKPAVSGYHDWTVPPITTSQGKIRIRDAGNNSISDASDSPFSISYIQVTSQGSTENWQPGDTRRISWSSGNINSVDVYIVQDNGQPILLRSNVNASLGYIDYTVNGLNTTNNNRIKITEAGNPQFADFSDGIFRIADVRLITPNGGEIYQVGKKMRISWNRSANISNLNFDLSTDNGSTWINDIITNVDAGNNNGSYEWVINRNLPSANVKLRIKDATAPEIDDISDLKFDLKYLDLTQPTGYQDTLLIGDQFPVYWDYGNITNLKIDLSTDNGNSWVLPQISSTPASARQYNWTVPATPTRNAKIKITDAAYPDKFISDSSEISFVITGVKLQYPNSGAFDAGGNIVIRWKAHSSVLNVRISYSPDNGSSWSVVPNGDNVQASLGQLQWRIPSAVTSEGRIKIEDVSQQGISYDISDLPFSIGTISVTVPGPGIIWQVGSTHKIRWNSVSSVSQLRINFQWDSKDTVIAPSVSAYQDGYDWVIPNIPTDNGRIKIFDKNDTTINAVSEHFVIADVKVLSPDGGEIFQSGKIVPIRWYSKNISQMIVKYSTDNGANWVLLGTVNGAAGSYDWIPDTDLASQSVKIKLENAANVNVTDVSDNFFTIKKLKITSPVNNEGYTFNTPQTITWQSGFVQSVKIELSTNDGATWISPALTNATNANTGSYIWQVGNTFDTKNAKIRISDVNYPYIRDSSALPFTIGFINQVSPGLGVITKSGNPIDITWDNSSSINNVDIHYSTDGGNSWNTQAVVTGYPVNTTNNRYTWIVPANVQTTRARVRITDSKTGAIRDESENFTIHNLQITSPAGGEFWQAGTVKQITWGTTSVNAITLEYKLNAADTTWNPIPGASGISGTSGTFQWAIPASFSGAQSFLRIKDVSKPEIFHITQPFKIGSIQLTAPLSSDVMKTGTRDTVRWTNSGSVNKVNIDYSVDGGSWNPVATNIAASSGYYIWDIDDVSTNSSTNVKVRIRDAEAPQENDIFSLSSAFTLVYIKLTTPNGEELVQTGRSRQIRWEKSTFINSFRIDLSTNGGITWKSINPSVATPGNPGNYTYNWLVPEDTVAVNCKVRITSLSYPFIYDESDNNFKIVELKLGAPGAGVLWKSGTQKQVRWTAKNLTSVRFYLSTNGGSSFEHNIEGVTDASLGTLNWNIPENYGTNTAKVKIVSTEDDGVFDVSPLFSIPKLKITEPNTVRDYQSEKTMTIIWDAAGVDQLRMEYSYDGGRNWGLLRDNIQPSTTNLSWLLPDSTTNAGLLKIIDKRDTSIYDISDEFFTVSRLRILTPSGGERFLAGKFLRLKWNSDPSVQTVTVEFKLNSNSPWSVLGDYSGPAGFADLPIDTSFFSGNAKFKIYKKSNQEIVSESGEFVISKIKLNAPNGGEVMQTGALYDVIYDAKNTSGQLKLLMTTNNGIRWDTIANDLNPGVNKYVWTVPNSPAASAKLMLLDKEKNDFFDVSDGSFAIGGVGIDSITTQTIWQTGKTQRISWRSNNLTDLVIRYSTDNGNTWDIVHKNSPSVSALQGYYDWLIPDTKDYATGLARIKIEAYNNNQISNVSPVFRVAYIKLTEPKGGEYFQSGYKNYIKWDAKAVSSLKLEYTLNNGLTYTQLEPSIPAGGGQYEWIIDQNTYSNQAKVRISDVSSPAVNSVSTNVFTISKIKVNYPVTSTVWQTGTIDSVTWDSDPSVERVKIRISYNGGDTWDTLSMDYDASLKKIGFVVKDTVTARAIISIEAINSSVLSKSGEFTIMRLALTKPNGGEILQAGKPANIEWKSNFTGSHLRILYSSDGGSVWNPLDNYYPASLQKFIWNVPDSLASTFMKVKITQAGNDKYQDMSDNNFSVTRIKMINPSGGEKWQAGTVQQIRWETDPGIQLIHLTVSKNAGASFPPGNRIATNFNAAAGVFNWTVDSSYYSDSVVIKIERADNDQIFHTSGVLSVSRLKLVYPNGNELWQAGKTYRIRWAQANLGANIKLEYSADDGVTWLALINSYPSSYEYFDWTVPENISGDKFRIRITDLRNPAFNDISDSKFRVALLNIKSPASDSLWQVGTRKRISWSNKFAGNTILQFSSNNGLTWQNASGTLPQTDSTFDWTVPDPLGEPSALIRIYSVSDTSINALSQSFRIVSLSLSSPNGNEFWTAGAVGVIKWSSTNIDTVAIEVSLDGGQTYGAITNRFRSVNGNSNQFEWNIPQISTSNGKIRVLHFKNRSIYDESDLTFKIGNIRLTAPEANNNYLKNEKLRIAWDTANASAIGNLKVFLSSDAGVSWGNPIIPSVSAAAGNIDYNVSNLTPGDKYRIRIASVSDSNFNAVSGNFIISSLELLSPTGGEYIRSGSQAQIKWNAAYIDSVNIKLSTNGGVSWDQTLISGLRADAGTYLWNVPSSFAYNNVRVLVEYKSKPQLKDASDSNIVVANVTLDSPNGGENLQANISSVIKFLTTANVDSVLIEFRALPDSNWRILRKVAASSGTNIFNWTPLQDDVTKNGLIRVTYPKSRGNISDVSDNSFSVNNLQLTYPNGGEYFNAGENVPLSWEYGGKVENIKIEFVPLFGAPRVLVSNHPANTPFSFQTGSTVTQGKIRISSGSITDMSDANFSVVNLALISPKTNDRVQTGKPLKIRWAASPYIDSVLIEVSLSESGENWSPLNNNRPLPAGVGLFDWTPDSSSSNAKVRVRGINSAANIMGKNDLPFIIKRLDITYPLVQNQFIAGDLLRINWQQSNNIDRLKFTLSTDGGVNWQYDTTIVNSGSWSGEIRWRLNSEINSSNCRIKILSDMPLDTNIYSISAPFRIIKPNLQLVYPNGNEFFQAGNLINITWTADSSLNFLVIKYSSDGGMTYTPISPVISASAGRWSWPIPSDYDTRNGKILIESTENAIINARSVSVFKIGSITLLAPNGSEGKWQTGTSKIFRWQSSASVERVKLDLSTDGGSSWRLLRNDITAGNGQIELTLPEFPTTSARFRVSDAQSSNEIKDQTSESISLVSLKINRPVITDTLQAGKKFRFTWNNSEGITTLRIHYRLSESSDWVVDDNSISASNRQFDWTVPSNLFSRSFRVKLVDDADTTINSQVPGNITVKRLLLTAPAGGDRLLANSTYRIMWNQNFADYINLLYSIDGGTNWTQIESGVSGGQGVYDWTVPDLSSDNCKIRVQDSFNPDIFSENENGFRIFKPAVLITSPNSAASFQAGRSLTVKWNSILTDTLRLEISYDGGITFLPVTERIPAAAGFYTFTLDNLLNSENVRLKITSVEYPQYYDICDQPLKVYRLNLTSFNEFVFYQSGEQYTVNWDVSTFASRLKLDLIYDQNQNAVTIDDNIIASAGSFSFTMPNVPTRNGRLRLRLADIGADSVVSQSISPFVIGDLNLVTPVSASIIQERRVFNITFTKTSSIDRVDLEYSRNGSFTDAEIIERGVLNENSYAWECPEGSYSPSARIRISATGSELRVRDQSQPFRVASIKVISPDSLANWEVGKTHKILFRANELNSDLSLFLYIDTLSSTPIPIGTASQYDTSFNWNVTEDLLTEKAYVKLVTDDGKYSEITGKFRLYKPFLQLDPMQNKKYAMAGKTYKIQWESRNVQNIKIEYSAQGASNFQLITPSHITNNGVNSYNWPVPQNLASDNVIIKITDLNNPLVNSVLPFDIRIARIQLTSPLPGEVFQSGKAKEIKWVKSENVDYVNLRYRFSRSEDTVDIALNFPADSGSYEWTVPDNSSDDCLVMVELVGSDWIVSDSSGTGNKIKKLEIKNPVEREFVRIPGTYRIRWEASSNVSRIKLRYRYNVTGEFQDVRNAGNLLASTGYFDWDLNSEDSSLYSADDLNNVQLQITDINTPQINSFSKYFVFGGLKLLRPNGGEVFLANSVTEIKWNNTKNIDYIRIEYSTDNGESWYLPDGMNSIDANSEGKKINWQIGANPSQNCLLKISRTSNPSSISDVSDSIFTVSELKLLSPGKGAFYMTGETVPIKWSSRFINTVDLILLVDGQQKAIIRSNLRADSGQYNWAIPDDIQLATKKAQILIRDHTSSEAYDLTDDLFSIHYLKIITPEPQMSYGSKVLIQWNHSDSTIERLNIDFSTNNGISWLNIKNGIDASDGRLIWDVTNSDINDAKTGVIIRLQNADLNLMSLKSSPFNLAYLKIKNYSLAGSKLLQAGKAFRIEWTAAGSAVQRVALDYSDNEGLSWNPIDNATDLPASDKKFDWLVPDNPTKKCRLRIRSISALEDTSTSATNFIIAKLEVASPNSRVAWDIGSEQTVSWDSENIDSIRIWISRDGGMTKSILQSFVPVTNKEFKWIVEEKYKSANVRIIITDQNDYQISDMSDDSLMIADFPNIIPFEIYQSNIILFSYTVNTPGEILQLINFEYERDSNYYPIPLSTFTSNNLNNLGFGTGQIAWNSMSNLVDFKDKETKYNFRFTMNSNLGVVFSVDVNNVGIDNLAPRFSKQDFEISQIPDTLGWDKVRLKLNNEADDINGPIYYTVYRSTEEDTTLFQTDPVIDTRNPDGLIVDGLSCETDYALRFEIRDKFGNKTVFNSGYQTLMAGDLAFEGDQRGVLNANDVSLFVNAWLSGNRKAVDLAPYAGEPEDKIRIIGNSLLNYEDVFTFARIWNFKLNISLSNASVSSIFTETDGYKRVNANFSSRTDSIVINLPAEFDSVVLADFTLGIGSQSIKLDSVYFVSPDNDNSDSGVLTLSMSNEREDLYAIQKAYLTDDAPRVKQAVIRYRMDNYKITEGDSILISYKGFGKSGNLTTVENLVYKLNFVPAEFRLYQNYPNPFNPSTTILYDIPQDTEASLVVYDILGSRVETVFNEFRKAGRYKLLYDITARNGSLASGVYFMRLNAGTGSSTIKMLLIK
ncbi:MAG: T9SS type A sorting domain-containing protein [Ignavibacteriaceae bacterium]|nr:T9SS type A sorting domain-containing protein [Ignavibacteriaceae bacterium]